MMASREDDRRTPLGAFLEHVLHDAGMVWIEADHGFIDDEDIG